MPTAKDKLVTAQIREGDTVLFRNAGSFLTVAHNKTSEDIVPAIIKEIRVIPSNGYRQPRRYVFTTDLGVTDPFVGAQTHYSFDALSVKNQGKLALRAKKIRDAATPENVEGDKITFTFTPEGVKKIKELKGVDITESIKPAAPSYESDRAWQNFDALSKSAPTEAARDYWAIKANERVFLV